VNAGEGAAERVAVTADDATLPAVEGIAAILHAHGLVVERRVFVRAAAEEPRRVVLLALAVCRRERSFGLREQSAVVWV